MNKREYIQANKDWLEVKSKEDGVKALPKGIYYKVLSEGRSAEGRLQGKNKNSATPTVRSILSEPSRVSNTRHRIMYGIADLDNCYCSCEKVFRPDLEGKPIVVLSNLFRIPKKLLYS